MRVLLQKLIDLLDAGPAALGNALPAAAVDQLMIAALLRRHRIDNCLDADQFLFVHLHLLHVFQGANTRKHTENLIERAHLPDLLQLVTKILEGEAVGKQFFLEFNRFFLVDDFFRFFDKRKDVAHSHDSRYEPIGME